MNEEQGFGNPSLKKGSGGMVWWKCPRCHGQDVFLGKRPAGSVGPIAEVGDTGNYMAVQRQILVDVWVCRPCGEIATKSWRSLTESEIEADKALSKEIWSGAFPFQMAGVLLLFFGFIGVMLWLLVDIFSS
jgi:hypothetical protein